MKPSITCKCVGNYPLTRGRHYTLISYNEETNEVTVRDDNNRLRCLSTFYFDRSGGHVPTLTQWRFDEPVVVPESGRDENNNWVDIRLQFDDGTQRWCQMITPDFLKGMLNRGEPMFYSKHLIVVRDLTEETVEHVLIHLDEQDELADFSLPLEEEPSDDS